MDTLQKFSIPLSIIVAGGLIAFALYNSGGSSGGNLTTRTAPIELRAVSADEHIRGSADARVAMVEFSDTECPFCKQFDTTMHEVIGAYDPSEVAWIYRHFPLEQLHPKAPKEAEALECAWEQSGPSCPLGSGNDIFWQFSDKVYSRTNSNNSLDIGVYNAPKPTPSGTDGKPYYIEKTPRSSTDAGQLSDFAVELGLNKQAFEACMKNGIYTAKVTTDAEEASNSGGNGTPYVVFISKNKISKDTENLLDSLIPSVGPDTFVISDDGFRISMSGALPFDVVQKILDTLLK